MSAEPPIIDYEGRVHQPVAVIRGAKTVRARFVADYLHAVRFSNNHLGLGDIRMTVGQQDDLLDCIRARGNP